MVQEIFSSFTVSDYFFIKSRLFAQNNLSKDELTLFYRLFDIMLASLPKPDLLVYLHADIQCLQKNIKKRDRSYEREITKDYLLKIQEKYLDFFKKQKDFPVLIIEVTDSDFVQNDEKYQKILAAIKQPYSFGVHHLSLH
jgi:deoxyadenosine/deoxycytidine kinase